MLSDDCQASTSSSSSSTPESDFRDHCTFYQKIGACRHGEKCSRLHVPPTKSRVVLIKNMYRLAKLHERIPELLLVDVEALFLKEFLSEFSCGAAANRACRLLAGRWFAGSILDVSLCPVRDFREARCRQHDNGTCGRGGHCNFMHLHVESPGSSLATLRELARTRFGSIARPSTPRHRSRSNSSERLPQRYQITSSDSSSSASFPSSSNSEESSEEKESEVPKAFRSAIAASDDEGEPSEEEIELARARQRIERKRRWSAVRSKFEAQIHWDEDRERNFVFSLL